MSYTKELLSAAVAASTSYAGVIRHLGLSQAGGTQAHVARRIRQLGIDTTHFTGQSWARGQPSSRRRSPDQILVRRADGAYREKPRALRRAMREVGIAYVCSNCALDPDLTGVTLHVDHIDGDWLNNERNNVRFLCPNCHSLTPNYCVARGRSPTGRRQTV